MKLLSVNVSLPKEIILVRVGEHGPLFTAVLEKRQDFAVLAALGASGGTRAVVVLQQAVTAAGAAHAALADAALIAVAADVSLGALITRFHLIAGRAGL